MASEKKRRLKPKEIYKRAFFNQYNMILLAGAGLFALTTGTIIPILIGGGVEALWMVFGPDTDFFHRWAEKQLNKEEAEQLRKELDDASKTLDSRTLERFEALRYEASEISRLAAENPGTGTQLVAGEMDKLGQLLRSFVRLSVTRARLGSFLEETSEREIEREITEHTRRLEREKNNTLRQSLERSLGLAEKRLKQHQTIKSSWEAIGLQLDNIEKSFGYLKSCIINASGTEEFSSELDDLIDGVDAAEQTYAETGELMSDLRRMRAADSQRRQIGAKS